MNLSQFLLVILVFTTVITALWYPRPAMNRWIAAGAVLTTAAEAVMLVRALFADPSHPTFAHLILQAGWVLIVAGLVIDRGPYGQYIGPRLIFDLSLITPAWMMLVDAAALTGHHGPARHLASVSLLAEVINVILVVLLFAERRVLGMGILGLSQGLFVASDLITASAHLSGTTPSYGWRVGLAGAGVAGTACSLLCMRRIYDSTVGLVAEPDAERTRGAIVAVLVAVPLSIVVPLAFSGRGMGDPWVASMGLWFIAAFWFREAYRSRQNHRLLIRLSEQAARDPLTGLRNRRALSQLMTELTTAGTTAVVVSLDVDRFKEINRLLGHTTGDAILANLARVMEASGIGDCFRLGGDEFCIVSGLDEENVLSAADRLRKAAPDAFKTVPGVEALAITISLGVASSQNDAPGTDALEVLSRSTLALRLAKLERNQVRAYTAADAAQEAHRGVLEHRLRAALGAHDITFLYQPIVDISDGQVIGFEALARWTDTQLGQVSPGQFVPIAEETGLIHDLGLAALASAGRVAAQLRRAGRELSVSVNISPLQLRRPTFVTDLCAVLESVGCEPSWLTAEVTEGIFMDLDDPAVLTLFSLADLGVNVAIDDFGSGYSSFGYMARLPVTVVKVDRSLVKQVEQPTSRSVIEALLTIADTHELRIVMEGVETEREVHLLTELGARIGQGWYWSAGVSEQRLPELLLPRELAVDTPS